jgi:hypothetical protein
MKKRYLYALLFGLPGLFIAGLTGIFGFAALTGFLWLYVFGDNPWPAYVEPVLAGLFVLVVLVLWTVFLLLGYFVGRSLENDPVLNRAHILVSVGLTAAFILFLLFHQWSVGNLGPKSDSALCSEFCSLHGYAGSGMPAAISGDRTCSCYDNAGNEVLQIPVDHLDPDFGK